MTVVEEEVFGENIQFVVDLKQMHQDLLLQRRPARASMGTQELVDNAMASSGRLRRPCAPSVGRKAQLQWGEGRGRLAAALARAPARDALARICL